MTPKELTDMITNLLNSGWTPEDIDDGFSRLVSLRLSYQHHRQGDDQLLDPGRLSFVRWLYLTGKISDWPV